MRPASRIAALVLCIVVWNCLFDGPASRGGGSDTETLTGLVVTQAGVPAAGTPVKAVPCGYDPSRPDTSLIRSLRTDDSGHFRFDKLDTGRFYNVIAGSPGTRDWAFAESLKTGPGNKSLTLGPSRVFLITIRSINYPVQDSGVAYFPGTDILARCHRDSASVVDSVPAGVLHIVVESGVGNGWKHDTTLIKTGDTLDVQADSNGIICASPGNPPRPTAISVFPQQP